MKKRTDRFSRSRVLELEKRVAADAATIRKLNAEANMREMERGRRHGTVAFVKLCLLEMKKDLSGRTLHLALTHLYDKLAEEFPAL